MNRELHCGALTRRSGPVRQRCGGLQRGSARSGQHRSITYCVSPVRAASIGRWYAQLIEAEDISANGRPHLWIAKLIYPSVIKKVDEAEPKAEADCRHCKV